MQPADGSMRRSADGDVGAGPTTPSPLPSTVPLALERMANVHGTAHIAAGHRLRGAAGPGSGPRWQKTSIVGGPREKLTGLQEKILGDFARDRREANLAHDQKLRDKRLIREKINRRVQLGMEAYEEDLERRRDKLRELLVREETQYIRELIDTVRRNEELRLAELKAKAIAAEEERKRAQQRLLEEKRLQRLVGASMELREAWMRARTHDVKRANLAQIAEAEERRRLEREYEVYWQELQERLCAEALAADAAKEAQHAELERDTAAALLGQIEARRATCPAADASNPETFHFGCSERDEAFRRDQQRRLREDLDGQLRDSRASLERMREQERALDAMGASLDLPRPASRADKEARRREIAAFMEHLKEFCKSVSRREAEAEECARRWAAEADARRREDQLQGKEERRRRCRELKLAWDRQLEEKRGEPRPRPDYDDNCKLPEDRIDKAALRERARAYGCQLIAQREEDEAKRARERRQEEDIERRRAEKEREEQRLVRELSGNVWITPSGNAVGKSTHQ